MHLCTYIQTFIASNKVQKNEIILFYYTFHTMSMLKVTEYLDEYSYKLADSFLND